MLCKLWIDAIVTGSDSSSNWFTMRFRSRYPSNPPTAQIWIQKMHLSFGDTHSINLLPFRVGQMTRHSSIGESDPSLRLQIRRCRSHCVHECPAILVLSTSSVSVEETITLRNHGNRHSSAYILCRFKLELDSFEHRHLRQDSMFCSSSYWWNPMANELNIHCKGHSGLVLKWKETAPSDWIMKSVRERDKLTI